MKFFVANGKYMVLGNALLLLLVGFALLLNNLPNSGSLLLINFFLFVAMLQLIYILYGQTVMIQDSGVTYKSWFKTIVLQWKDLHEVGVAVVKRSTGEHLYFSTSPQGSTIIAANKVGFITLGKRSKAIRHVKKYWKKPIIGLHEEWRYEN